MLFGLLPTFAPTTAYAATAGSFTIEGGAGYNYSGNTLTITANGTYTIGMATPGATTTDRIVVKSGLNNVNITLGGVSIDLYDVDDACAFDMDGATVNLTLQGVNTLKSGRYKAGIHVPEGSALTITAASAGTLNASCYRNGGAGIGGDIRRYGNCGTVTINGGTVNATGTVYGSAIGGGVGGGLGGYADNGGNGGTVIITGGVVNAMGNTGAASIGGSGGGTGANVTISGGVVNAVQDDYTGGWGIGGDNGVGTLTITGGSVRHAAGGNVAYCEATATNGAGKEVYLTTLTVNNPAVANAAITAGSIGGVNCTTGTPNASTGVYGIKDVKTDGDGKLYFWLPVASDLLVGMTAGGALYEGTVSPKANGTAAATLTASIPPALSSGTIKRTSDAAATIGFATNKAGTAYYTVVNGGATAPTNTAVKNANKSLGAVSGTVSGKAVTLAAGNKDIYVVVQDALGNISTPLKIEAPAFVADIIPPVLSGGNVGRTSNTAATIGFTTNEAGEAYYIVLESNADAPASGAEVKAANKSLGAVSEGNVNGKAVTLTTGVKDIYVVVEDEVGNVSDPLKITAAAYDAKASFLVSGGGYCTTLADALAAVPDGGTITMLRNINESLGVPLNVNKAYTIDLGGYTLACINPFHFLTLSSGNITIRNGTIATEPGYFPIRFGTLASASLLVVNLNIAVTLAGTAAISCLDGSVTIHSGHFVSQDYYALQQTGNRGSMELAPGSSADKDPWKNDFNIARDVTVTAAPDAIAPTLTAGSVNRASHTAATIGFTTSEWGALYYTVVESGENAPANEAVKAGTSLGTFAPGAISGRAVTLTAGAKDIYVVVEDLAGNLSAPLKIEAAAFDLPFSGGEGTADDPYLISNAAELDAVRGFLDSHFKLANDIDLTSYGAGYNGGAGWSPIGKEGVNPNWNMNAFKGTFDGDGHTISGLYIDNIFSGTNFFSLFGKVSGATIKNLGVTEVNINSTSQQTGAIAGRLETSTVIMNC
jgi:hypothetical protein